MGSLSLTSGAFGQRMAAAAAGPFVRRSGHTLPQMDGLMDVPPHSLCNLQPPQKLHHLGGGAPD